VEEGKAITRYLEHIDEVAAHVAKPSKIIPQGLFGVVMPFGFSPQQLRESSRWFGSGRFSVQDRL